MPNGLASDTSPYLLQHADNPVDWWEWGPEAFEEARRRGVPVLALGRLRRLSLVPRGSPVGGWRRKSAKPQSSGLIAVRVGWLSSAVGHRFRGFLHHFRASLGLVLLSLLEGGCRSRPVDPLLLEANP